MSAKPRVNAPLVFRLHENAPNVVREVLLERGWEEFDPQAQEEGDWNLFWRSSAFRRSDYENILPWQRLNHHPKTTIISRKDCLVRNLRRMQGTYGPALYNFSPLAFILPNDYTRFLEEYTKNRGKRVYWICKPVALSRGRGIFIFEDIKDLTYDSTVIVQKYISNSFLISGYKFDLRIYVCVKSFRPLTIYIYEEGLVRFATEKYDLTSPDNLFSHLTNTSINKFSLFYTMDKEHIGQGCKWSMSKFRTFLHSQDINEAQLWQKINNIVTLTLLTIAPSIPSSPNCVELFGFDILIDSNFKPWLLEVNYSPALSLDCPVDIKVKKGLINDLIDLMNYRKIDRLRQTGCPGKCCLPTMGLVPKITRIVLKPKPAYKYKHQSNCCVNPGKPFCSNSYLNPKTANKKTFEVPHHSSEFETTESDDWELVSPPSLSSNACTLPTIHIHKSLQKPPVLSWDKRTHDRTVPVHRVGDFILTFPFNEVTQKASQGTLDVRTILHEVHKLMTPLTSSRVYRETRTNNNGGAVIKNRFTSLLWGTRIPS